MNKTVVKSIDINFSVTPLVIFLVVKVKVMYTACVRR